MSTADTTYKVLTVYEIQDRTSKALGDIEGAAKRAAKATEGLGTMLKGVGGAVLGGAVFSKAKSALIDYNKSLEDSKVTIAGMLSMFTGAPIEKSFDRAGKSVERFQEMAKKSSLTTKDLVQTSAGLVRPLVQAGVGMKDIEELSFGVANAAKAMGMEGGVVARDIEQATTSKVGMMDRFARNILAQKEIGYTDYHKFNALSIEKRVEVLKKALTTKAIRDMAQKQGEDTFSGVTSTLQDNFEILLGKIGLPLFKAITNEVKGWNSWLDKNQRKIDEFAKSAASTLISGFRMVKDAFVFVYNHADTLIAIAKAYAAIKIGSMLSSGLAGSGGGLVSQIGAVLAFGRKKIDAEIDPKTGQWVTTGQIGRGRQAVGGLKGVAENAGMLGASLGAGYAFGNLINDVTKLSSTLSGSTRVNGELLDITDKTTEKYALLVKSMASFDKALQKAADDLKGEKGAKGTASFANIQGAGDYTDKQIQFLEKLEKWQKYNPDSVPGMFGQGSEDKTAFNRAMMESMLKKSGLFDAKEIAEATRGPRGMREKLENRQKFLDTRRDTAASMADEAWATLPKEVKKSLDQQKVTQALMAYSLQQLGSGNLRFTLSKEDVATAMKMMNEEIDPFDRPQGKPPSQHVTINIQQVSAKDPNRWLAEMDDLVQRRVRAPTRAKGAWKNTPK